MTTALLLLLLAALAIPPARDAATARAVWLADLDPGRLQPGPGRFVFVPGSATDEDAAGSLVEAARPPGVLRVVFFAKGETDGDLNLAQPIVVEGVLLVIRHPARGEFPAVVEVKVREARRVRYGSRGSHSGAKAIDNPRNGGNGGNRYH